MLVGMAVLGREDGNVLRMALDNEVEGQRKRGRKGLRKKA